MDAALYFELVDAIAKIDGQAGLVALTDRVTATDMHPIERRVLDRALRARETALALQPRFLASESLSGATPEAPPRAARG